MQATKQGKVPWAMLERVLVGFCWEEEEELVGVGGAVVVVAV